MLLRQEVAAPSAVQKQVPDQEQALLSAFDFHGWRAVFTGNMLILGNEHGFQITIRDVTPGSISVQVVGSTIQISAGRLAQVEFHIEDESARNWIIRFLHYWRFHIDGVRIECGVIVSLTDTNLRP